MKLSEFLRKETEPMELCVVRRGGWIVASYWIDYEDLFCRYLPHDLGGREVKGDEWDYLLIVDKNNQRTQIPCHYIDV